MRESRIEVTIAPTVSSSFKAGRTTETVV